MMRHTVIFAVGILIGCGSGAIDGMGDGVEDDSGDVSMGSGGADQNANENSNENGSSGGAPSDGNSNSNGNGNGTHNDNNNSNENGSGNPQDPTLTLSLSASALTVGDPLELTFELSAARDVDTTIRWSVAEMESPWPREYGVLTAEFSGEFPELGVEEQVLIPAGMTEAVVALESGDGGLARAMELTLAASSDLGALPDTLLSVSPRPDDIRDFSSTQLWSWRYVTSDGRVFASASSNAGDDLDSYEEFTWPGLPAIDGFIRGGDTSWYAHSQNGELIRLGIEAPGAAIESLGNLGPTLVPISASASGYTYVALALENSARRISMRLNGSESEDYAITANAIAASPVGGPVFRSGASAWWVRDGELLEHLSDNVAHVAANHGTHFVLLSDGTLNVYDVYANSGLPGGELKFEVPNAVADVSSVIQVVADHVRFFALHEDGGVSAVNVEPVYEESFSASAPEPVEGEFQFSSPPLQVAELRFSICGLMVGNTVECVTPR